MIKLLNQAKKHLDRQLNFVRVGLALPAAKKALGIKPKRPKKPTLGKEVVPPFTTLDQHMCFGCSPRNERGLKMRFFEAKGWTLAGLWRAESGYENYPGMIHGGILTTLMDELVGQALFHSTGHMPVSLTANVTWYKAVKVNDLLTVAARVTAKYDSFYAAESYLFNEEGKVMAKLSGQYYTPSLAKFKKIANLEQIMTEAEAWFAP